MLTKFKLTENSISNYGEQYRDRVFTVIHASNTGIGYDESLYPQLLYSAYGFPFSVYEYEIEPA